MRRRGLLPPLSLGLVIGAPLFASEAKAEPTEPFTAWSPTVSAGYRRGSSFETDLANAWATGLGLNVGYTIGSVLHLGVSYDSFFGERRTSSSVSRLFTIESDSETASTTELLGFLGGDGAVSKNLVLRVFIGVGNATIEREVCVNSVCEDKSGNSLVLSPGFRSLYRTPVGSLDFGTRWSHVTTESDGRNALVFSIGWGYAG